MGLRKATVGLEIRRAPGRHTHLIAYCLLLSQCPLDHVRAQHNEGSWLPTDVTVHTAEYKDHVRAYKDALNKPLTAPPLVQMDKATLVLHSALPALP